MTVAEGAGIRVVREARGRVTGAGVELAYGFWPGRGMPIVAIHALTTSYKSFVGIGERLAGRRPLFAPDLRGRGDSDKPEGPYGMATHAADVAAAMRAIGIGPAVVAGHSMGAYVAASLAAEEPSLVAGVVLLDGGHPPDLPPGVDPDEHLDRILGPVVGRLRERFGSVDEYLDTWRRLPTFALPSGLASGSGVSPTSPGSGVSPTSPGSGVSPTSPGSGVSPTRLGPWVESYLAYDLGGDDGEFRPKAAEAAVRADFADMGDQAEAERRLGAIRCPVMVIRAESGLAPDQPGVLSAEAVDRIRECCVADLTEHTVAETTHYTIVLAEPGASTVAGLLVEFAAACGV